MLADPQTITINAIAKAMPRISYNGTTSTYRLRSTTDEYVLTIKHTDGKISGGVAGASHVVKVEYTVFATAVLPATTTVMWCTLQVSTGMDLVVTRNTLLGLCAYLTSATIDKLIQGES